MFEQYLLQLTQGVDIRKTLIDIKKLLGSEDNIVMLKNTAGYSVKQFSELLTDTDPKVRKNAALILGMLNEADSADILYKAYESENTLFVKSSYLQALSYCDYNKFKINLHKRLEELTNKEYNEEEIKHIAEELRMLRKMLPDASVHERHKFHNPSTPLRVVLTCSKESADKVIANVYEKNKVSDMKQIFCGITFTTDKITSISKIRTYKELLFPLNGMKPMNKSEISSNIVQGNLVTILKMVHNIDDDVFYFRVTAKNLDVTEIASRIQAMSKGKLINSVSDYEIEIRLIAGKDERYIAFLKLYTIGDVRFKYRKNHIAASLHPVNAALITEYARDYLKKDVQILDPFCGVGTLLIERNKLVPARHIYGIDIYGKAIEGARENSKSAGCNINYINRDYFDFSHEYLFDEIISDFPTFATREETDRFYDRFFKKSSEILKSQGVIVAYSGEKNLIKKYLRINDNYKLLREFIMSEKEEKYIFIIARN